jgi:hypothetical protein
LKSRFGLCHAAGGREVGEDVVGAGVLNSQIEISERIPHA